MLSWRERDCHYIYHSGLNTQKARPFRTDPAWNIKNSGTWTVPTLGLLAPDFTSDHHAEHWDIVGLSHVPTRPTHFSLSRTGYPRTLLQDWQRPDHHVT